MISLIVGGSGSGKSGFAERLAAGETYAVGGQKEGDDKRPVYLATMIPFGSEGKSRIRKHRRQRQGMGFETLELFTDVGRAADRVFGRGVILECITNLLANEIFGSGSGTFSETVFDEKAIDEAVQRVCDGVRRLGESASDLVIVSGITDCGYGGEGGNDSEESYGGEGSYGSEGSYGGEESYGSEESHSGDVSYGGEGSYSRETLAYLRALGRVNAYLARLADEVTEVFSGIPVYIKQTETMDKRGRESLSFQPFETELPSDAPVLVIGGYGEDKRGFAAGAGLDAGRRVLDDLNHTVAETLRALNGREGDAYEKELDGLVSQLAEEGALVLCDETGCGVIPVEYEERRLIEALGYVKSKLADRACLVIRLICNIPVRLK